MAAAGQSIDPPLSAGVGGRPATGKKACLLETMQRRIDCPFREIEGLPALALDRLDDGIAMGRARRQRGQYDQVEVSFEHFSFHTLQRYALRLEQSSLGRGACPSGGSPSIARS